MPKDLDVGDTSSGLHVGTPQETSSAYFPTEPMPAGKPILPFHVRDLYLLQ